MLFLIRLIGRLPLGLSQRLAGWLAGMVYLTSGAMRTRVREHLLLAEQATREDPLPIRYTPALARASAIQSGAMIGETPWVWFRPLQLVASRVHCVNNEVLEQAEAAGRGILFVTPHIGAFDAAARWYAHRRGVTVLYKPPKRESLRPLMKAARSGERMQAAPANVAGLRMCVRALRAGQGVAILPDQVPTDGDGRWVQYFGRPAYTMTLPLKLAQMTGAAVVLVLCERLPAGQGWRLHAQRMTAEPTPENLNRTMEQWVARLPSQYLWSYNRYKRPAGVTGPA